MRRPLPGRALVRGSRPLVIPGANGQDATIAPRPLERSALLPECPEPERVKNRLHLDLITDQFDLESKRLTDLGAAPIRDIEKAAARWTTFADPEGNEFDLVTTQPASPGRDR